MWALIRAALPDAMAQNGVGFTLDPKMSPFLGGISAPPLVLEFSPNGISPPLLAPSASWPRYLPALRSSGHCSDVSTHSPPRPRPCCYFLLFCAAEGTRNYIILSRLKSSRPPPQAVSWAGPGCLSRSGPAAPSAELPRHTVGAQ